jgi:hypothetical protein
VSAKLQPKQLSRLQAFLTELKTSVSLFREVLVEVKELLVILIIIVFFLVGAWETLKPKIEPLFTHGQIQGVQHPP